MNSYRIYYSNGKGDSLEFMGIYHGDTPKKAVLSYDDVPYDNDRYVAIGDDEVAHIFKGVVDSSDEASTYTLKRVR
jgi:hypothetical protein